MVYEEFGNEPVRRCQHTLGAWIQATVLVFQVVCNTIF